MTIGGRLSAIERQLKAAAANFSDDIPIAIAADFLRGGAPDFARAFDRRGMRVGAFQRRWGELWTAFRDRAG